MFGVEGQPDGFRVLTLVRREAEIPLVGLNVFPAVLGVARGDIDLVPEGVEAVRHVEKQHLGLRPGRELLGRLGQNGVRPELAGTLELLLRRNVPERLDGRDRGLDRHVHRGSQTRLLDDAGNVHVREAGRSQHTLELDLLTDGGVEEAGHDGSLPFCDRRRLTHWFVYGYDELIFRVENGVLHARFVYKTPFSLESAKLLRFDNYYSTK